MKFHGFLSISKIIFNTARLLETLLFNFERFVHITIDSFVAVGKTKYFVPRSLIQC